MALLEDQTEDPKQDPTDWRQQICPLSDHEASRVYQPSVPSKIFQESPCCNKPPCLVRGPALPPSLVGSVQSAWSLRGSSDARVADKSTWDVLGEDPPSLAPELRQLGENGTFGESVRCAIQQALLRG